VGALRVARAGSRALVLVAVCGGAGACGSAGGSGAAAAAAGLTADDASIEVHARWWMVTQEGPLALDQAVRRVRDGVARAMAGVLEDGYPKRCTVQEPEDRSRPFTPVCVEGGITQDGLLVSEDGQFIRFTGIDFMDSRAHQYVIDLVPSEAAVAELSPEERVALPHVAIPYVPMDATNYRERLPAVERGIRMAGGEVW